MSLCVLSRKKIFDLLITIKKTLIYLLTLYQTVDKERNYGLDSSNNSRHHTVHHINPSHKSPPHAK